MTTPQNTARPKVLVALNGSPAAATALPTARAVAAQLGASVEVLHVTSEPLSAPELRRRLHLDSQEWGTVELRSRVGEPAMAILDAAAEPDVALVILTTHGRAVQTGRRLTHVAEEVLARTERPILLVRPEAAAAVRASRLGRLLLPLDGTPSTASALQPATELAGRLGASIDLLYVAALDQAAPDEPGSIGAPRYVDQPHHEWPHWTREVIERLCNCLAQCPPEVAVRMFLARGEIGDRIADFAAEHQNDAIVLVRRSRLEAGRARVLRRVLDRTPCPVLIVTGPTD